MAVSLPRGDRQEDSPPTPALGALRLYELYRNPLRQPQIIEADDSIAAAQYILESKAEATIIPASMVNDYPQLITVRNTEQVPAPAISASPKVEKEVQQAITKALLDAEKNPIGRKALDAINIARFEASDGEEYPPHAKLLQGMWAY